MTKHLILQRKFLEDVSLHSKQNSEISDSIVSIDEAMKAGFGWKDGPFEIWNYIGINEGKELMKLYGLELLNGLMTCYQMDIMNLQESLKVLLNIMR